MKLYLLNINEILPAHMELISAERAEKAKRYKVKSDQKRCVAGGILLRRFLGEREIKADGFGKPRADGVFFNLSHSGEWVVLAIGKCETGCDIERHKIVNPIKLGKIVFTENELRYIGESYEKLAAFYRLWTKKEALLKCMGEGFHKSPRSVDVSKSTFEENGKLYYMKTIGFADYTISACQQDKDFALETEVVHI